MNRPFVCSVCAKVFTRNENLERHKRSRHQGNTHRPYECHRCQTRFSRKDVCKRHAERCRGTRDQQTSRVAAETALDLNGENQLSRPTIRVTELQGDDIFSIFHRLENGHEQVNELLPDEISGRYDPILLSPPARKSNRDSQFGRVPPQHRLVAAYFEHFHPGLPILHRASFDMQGPLQLVQIVAAIGSIYMATTVDGDSAASYLCMGQSLWEAGYDECQNLIRDGWIDWRQPAVLQTWILHIVYGTYMGDAAQYQKAKSLLRSLVDYVQYHGLLAESVVYPDQSSSWRTIADRSVYDNEEKLRNAWQSYIDEESTKLCLYALQLLDFHILYPCNLRPMTSAVDLDWSLPHSSRLWEAESASSWIEALRDDMRTQTLMDPEDHLCLPCPSTKSLSLAMQSLMSDAPSLLLLSVLESSPITIVFLLTMLDALIRDMTRSLYQLPPALADPSPYHILSQNQNRQMAAVLKQITRLAEEQPESSRYGPAGPIWTAIERLSLAIRIGLYKPDDLLIGGVVSRHITAGLTTATHFTLGRSMGTRRSLRMLCQNNSGEDAVLLFLEEIVACLGSMLSSSNTQTMGEAPWVTVASYRILLATWRSFRWASSEMRRRAESNTQSRFDTPTIIFNSVIDAISQRLDMGQETTSVHSPVSVAGETCFSEAIHKFWADRSTWTVGSSMVPILEDISSMCI